MNAVTTPEWKFTSFSSYLKTFFTRDLPVYAVLVSVFFAADHIAQNTFTSAVYSQLASGFVTGMGYLGQAMLVFFAVLSAAAFGASIYAGYYRRQPMTRCFRMAAMSLVVLVSCEWIFIHVLRGDLGVISARTVAAFGL